MPTHATCTVLTQTLLPLASTGDPTDAPADTPLDSDPFTHISISGQGVQRDVATFRREPSERRQCSISHTTSRWASEAQRPQTASTLGVPDATHPHRYRPDGWLRTVVLDLAVR